MKIRRRDSTGLLESSAKRREERRVWLSIPDPRRAAQGVQDHSAGKRLPR